MRGLPPGCWGCEGRSNPCTCEQAQLVQVPPMPQRGGSSQGEVARGPGGRAAGPQMGSDLASWRSFSLKEGAPYWKVMEVHLKETTQGPRPLQLPWMGQMPAGQRGCQGRLHASPAPAG